MPRPRRPTSNPTEKAPGRRRPEVVRSALSEDLPPGYQAGRGRGYATERAFEGMYAHEQDLRAAEREDRTFEGAWGELPPSRPMAGPFPPPLRSRAPGSEASRGGQIPLAMRGPHAGHGPRGYRPSDGRIYEALCDELMLQPDIDPSEVTVKVERGEVTLTGTVPDRWTKFAIEDIAEGTLGAREVHNRLRLRPPGEEEEGALGRGTEIPEEADATGEEGKESSEELH